MRVKMYLKKVMEVFWKVVKAEQKIMENSFCKNGKWFVVAWLL